MTLPSWFWQKLLAIAADLLYSITSGPARDLNRRARHAHDLAHKDDPPEE